MPKHVATTLLGALLPCFLLIGCGIGDQPCQPGAPGVGCEDIEQRVQEVTAEYCVKCHGAEPQNGAPGHFRLDVFDAEQNGTESVADRVLERALGGTMPPPGQEQPSEEALEVLETWRTCRCDEQLACTSPGLRIDELRFPFSESELHHAHLDHHDVHPPRAPRPRLLGR